MTKNYIRPGDENIKGKEFITRLQNTNKLYLHEENEFRSKKYKIVYSVSDVRDLIKDTVCSIKTLRKYVYKEDIIIFYTPPRSKRNYEKLNKLGTVIKEDNLTDEIELHRRTGRYGDKFHTLYVDSPNVIFLDSDTFIRSNLSSHLSEDFEFSGRVAPNYYKMDLNIWNTMFAERGKTPIPMINTGFMIFHNYTHNKIADEVIDYMHSDLPRPDHQTNQKDQYALSLAVSNKKIKWMDNSVHAFMWRNEYKGEVLHGSIPTVGTDLKRLYNRMKLRLEKNLLSSFP